MSKKTYSELIKLDTLEDRYEYLKLNGKVGEETFGIKRCINQAFYKSDRWKEFRDQIIVRDNGCDLGLTGNDIFGPVLVHHLNPITEDDILDMNECLFDPENVICVSLDTHNAIHYGDISLLNLPIPERTPNDTCPWKK